MAPETDTETSQPQNSPSPPVQVPTGDQARRANGLDGKNGKIEGFIDRQIGVIADDIDSFAGALTDALEGSDPRMREALRSKVEPISNSLAKFADRMREQDGRRIVDYARKTLRDHPLMVTGGAILVAAGLTQAVLLTTRRSA